MKYTIIVLAGFVAVAYAGAIVPAAAPLAYAPAAAAASVVYPAAVAKTLVTKQVDDYDPNPQYAYAYDIQDGLTGDNKEHHETRNGDVVEGHYSLIEADGTRRTVHYTADPLNGFNAVVDKQAPAVALKTLATPVIAKAAAPINAAYASPALVAPAAPVAHAPLAYHAAPLKISSVYNAPSFYH